MPKLRYAIAALFFAVSFGCLALWWRSVRSQVVMGGPTGSYERVQLQAFQGRAIFSTLTRIVLDGSWQVDFGKNWEIQTTVVTPANSERIHNLFHTDRSFTAGEAYWGPFRSRVVRFPLWYASLIFALAGIGVLSFRRQFSIRSALIVVSAVAFLMAMAVAL